MIDKDDTRTEIKHSKHTVCTCTFIIIITINIMKEMMEAHTDAVGSHSHNNMVF